ncbi:MAG: RidA family protein [Caulobacteraceae bacterium]|nr:RidA family protein [Caulobacteraceae bacterium]
MKRILAPKSIAAPLEAYHHGVVIEAPTKIARLAGQIGVAPDGSIPEGAREQAEQAWDNVEAILAEAQMTLADICKVVSYVSGPENVAAYVEAQKRRLAGHNPPWTMVPLPSSGGRFVVEVDVEAMR